jgi:hypothetical protein
MLEKVWSKQIEQTEVWWPNRQVEGMVRKKVSVQADRAYVNRFDEVVNGLKEAGMTVQDEITVLGHFNGIAEAETIETLKAVPGVAVVNVIGDEGTEDSDEYSIADKSE